MGLIIAKFRKKTSTYDVLLKLENEITSIEDFQKRTEQAQRKIIFRFILLGVLIYFLLAFLLYFLYYSQVSSDQKVLWSLPLMVVFPLVIWIAKRLLSWYYNRKIRKNEKKLITLKEQKKKILENVMETETYKVAKKILDKFGETKTPIVPLTPTVVKPTPGPLSAYSMGRLESQGLRQRIAAQNVMRGRVSFGGVPDSPLTPVQRRQLALPSTPSSMIVPTSGPLATPRNMGITPLPLPRSILPRDRSVLDKMVDYLVGDGPSNRYALICQQCSSHNGMALKEEFEYISFRCCYCSHFNPSRKKKPAGPKFESPAIKSSSPESSESEEDSDSDSDSKPIVTELDDMNEESPKETSPLPSSSGDTNENIEKMEIVESEDGKSDETEIISEAENKELKELVENLETSNIKYS